MTKAVIIRIGAKVKGTKVRSILTINLRVIVFEKEITTAIMTSTGVTIVIEMIGMGPMFLLKIVKLLLWMVEVVWSEFRTCCIK